MKQVSSALKRERAALGKEIIIVTLKEHSVHSFLV